MKLGVGNSAHGRKKVLTAGGRVGQWWTDEATADAFIAWLGIAEGDRVLDAGAGMGALSLAAARVGAVVTALEVDRRLAQLLERDHGHELTVVHRDFLDDDVEPRQLMVPGADARPWDWVIGNYPWEGKLPELFMLRGVAIGRRTGWIGPLNLVAGGTRSAFWTSCPIAPVRAKALPRRPPFKGRKGGMRDVMFIEAIARTRATRTPARLELEVG
ncbi:MAG: Ribosomal adenine dimethylase [Planctomycetota bacterium]